MQNRIISFYRFRVILCDFTKILLILLSFPHFRNKIIMNNYFVNREHYISLNLAVIQVMIYLCVRLEECYILVFMSYSLSEIDLIVKCIYTVKIMLNYNV